MTTLKLNARAFAAILNGTKRVEIRANKPKVSSIAEGESLVFINRDDGCSLRCVVERKTLYPSVRALLETEGTEHTLSSTDDLEQGIRSIESISDYKEVIAAHGVWAIEVKDCRPA